MEETYLEAEVLNDEAANVLDEKAIIDDFNEFEENSRNKWRDLFEDIKDARSYMSGDQYYDDDKNMLGADRLKSKINIVQNSVRTIVNSYLPHQYKWTTSDKQLTNIGNDFLNNPDNITATVEALTNSVSTGLGVIVVSNDIDFDGSIKTIMYSVPDVTSVLLDPNIVKLNGTDQEKCAIVELKPVEFIKEEYGFDMVNDKPMVDISIPYDHKKFMALVTYYVKNKETQNIDVFKLLNNKVVEYTELQMTYIPVIPVFGEQTWQDDDKVTYQGIVKQLKPIQRLVNYSYTQLLERLAKAPKNTWLSSSEAIEGFEQYYKNADKSLNPLLLFNEWTADHKNQLKAPERISNEIQYADVSGILNNSLGLTNTIVGIPNTGLETEVTKTATEVLTNEKTFNNNIRCYIQHLRYSLQVVGMCVFEFITNRKLFGILKIDICEGPDAAMKKQEARIQLQQYASLITSDDDKRKLLIAEANIESDNEYITEFKNSLGHVPSKEEMQAQQLIQQANQKIQELNNQNLELQKQVNELQMQARINAYSTEQQLILANNKHKNDMEMKLLEARLNGQDEEIKSETELAKADAEIQKEALQLRQEELKTANLENKLFGGIN